MAFFPHREAGKEDSFAPHRPVSARINEKCFGLLKSPVKRIGFAPVPCPCARPLEDAFYPNAIDIIRVVEEKLGLSRSDLSNEEFFSYENKFKGPF